MSVPQLGRRRRNAWDAASDDERAAFLAEHVPVPPPQPVRDKGRFSVIGTIFMPHCPLPTFRKWMFTESRWEGVLI